MRTATGVDAVGILTGTLTNAAGQTTSVVRALRIPVAEITQATCDILHLDLGPLSLDLPGLQVDLSRIVLDITAESGPGTCSGISSAPWRAFSTIRPALRVSSIRSSPSSAPDGRLGIVS